MLDHLNLSVVLLTRGPAVQLGRQEDVKQHLWLYTRKESRLNELIKI